MDLRRLGATTLLGSASMIIACNGSSDSGNAAAAAGSAGMAVNAGGSSNGAGVGGTSSNGGRAGFGGNAAGMGGAAGTGAAAGTMGTAGKGAGGASGVSGASGKGGVGGGGGSGGSGAGGASGASGAAGGGVCGATGDHSPCVTGHALPLDCTCAKSVCQNGNDGDPYCCAVAWDLTCVERAYVSHCQTECTGGPIEYQKPSLVPASDVTIGYFTAGSDGEGNATGCGIDENKNVWCWGGDEAGQGNDGSYATKPPMLFPRKVPGIANAVEVAVNGWEACAIDTGGALTCWGDVNAAPNGCQDNKFTAPAQVLTNVKHVVMGSHGCDRAKCALKTDGSVWCWGSLSGSSPLLGDGKIGEVKTPTQVALPMLATELAINDNDVCAIMEDGTARCWGTPAAEIGNVTTTTTFNCFPMAWNAMPEMDCKNALGNITSLSIGNNVTCAVSAGKVYCMGLNSYGQLGVKGGPSPSVANPVLPAPAVAVRVGTGAQCALLQTGDVYCWGLSQYGSTGTAPPDKNEGQILPEKVLGLSNVVALSYTVQDSVGIARTMDGSFWTWGGNQSSVGAGVGSGIGSGIGFALTKLTFTSTPP